MQRNLAPLLLVAFMTLAARPPAQEATITWKERDLTLADLAAEAPEAAAVAKRWEAFVQAHAYRMALSDDRRVLLVLSSTFNRRKNKKEHHDVEQFLALAARACTEADRFLPRPGGPTPPLELVCTKEQDYRALLDHVATCHENIKPWTETAARKVAGFILSDPLLAAWVEDPEGVTEWNPYNEVVHRTAQLLIRRRTPHIPEWLLLGLAWHVEDEVQRSVYCFPHRVGFVAAAEHTDWGLWLANQFAERRRKKEKLPPALAMADFADWQPNSDDGFESGKAYVSFGVARYLARECPAKLHALQLSLHEAIDKGRKTWVSATEWKLDPNYRLPVDQQLALLDQIDKDFLKAVTGYIQQKKALAGGPQPRPKR